MTTERYFRTPDEARREAREAYMRLMLYVDTQRAAVTIPEPLPTPRKFSRSQLESGFANYPEPKVEPKRGPKAAGVSRRWTSSTAKRGPKPRMGSGARR